MRIFLPLLVTAIIAFHMAGCGDGKRKSTDSPAPSADPAQKGTKEADSSTAKPSVSNNDSTEPVPTAPGTKVIDPSDYAVSKFPELVEKPSPPLPCNQATPPTLYAGQPGGCTHRVSFISGTCQDQTSGFPGSAKACADRCSTSWESAKAWLTGAVCLIRDNNGDWVALKHK